MAEVIGRSRSTIDRRLRALDLGATTRLHTRAASQANAEDGRARRAKAALAELEILELTQQRSLATMRGNAQWSTVLRGEMGVEDTQQIGFIPPRDLREESSARAAMSATIAKLTVDDNGAQAAISMIERLAQAVGVPEMRPEP